jgi:hypothetical protein
MGQNELQDVNIVDLRGGMNDTDPANSLPDNQCVRADDVEFFLSMLGERRGGCDSISLTGSNVGANTQCVHLSQFFPSNDQTNAELWAVFATPGLGGQFASLSRRSGMATGSPQWFTVNTFDAIAQNIPDIYNIVSKAVNGKLFFTYQSQANLNGKNLGFDNGWDRLHVWDGAAFRRTGMFEANGPASVVDEGSGSFTGTRYYRERFVVLNSSGAVVVRGEASGTGNPGLAGAHTFTPSGMGKGATITRGNPLTEGETHWELEASLDNANFYRIATIPMSTTTYNDENASYAGNFPLSDAIGAYLLQAAAKFLATEGDRLILAGHWFDPLRASYVWWSPRAADPGVGNDERQPIVDTGGTPISTFYNLDGVEGGPITGLSNGVNGSFYAFKWNRIYKFVATDDVTNAYSQKCISTLRGAIPNSVFDGIDEAGNACVYFLDPVFGPSRIGLGGIQTIEGLRGTWKRVNLKAKNKVCHGVYYPFKRQCKWWLAADGNDQPSLGICNQVSTNAWMDSGAIRGSWSRFTGTLAAGLCSTIYNEWVNDASGNITLSERPFIGLASPRNLIQRTDVDTTDDGPGGQTYNAIIVTKPYIIGLLQKWAAITGTALLNAVTGASLLVRFIRDMGVETTSSVSISSTPAGSESMVVQDIDNLTISDARLIQVQFSDN